MRGTAGAKPIPMIRDGFRYPNLISASVGAHRYHIGGLTPLRTIVMFGAAITLNLRPPRGALAFECRNCWHLSQVDVLALVERFGAEALVVHLRRRARCRLCRSRRVGSLVRLKVGRKDLAWVPVPPRAGR
jgi:hypothetical protein